VFAALATGIASYRRTLVPTCLGTRWPAFFDAAWQFRYSLWVTRKGKKKMQSATVVPFPATRISGYVERQVKLLTCYTPVICERVLHHRLAGILKEMVKLGVDRQEAERHVSQLEYAIRQKMLTLDCFNDDAA
jgi:hypothetical protein